MVMNHSLVELYMQHKWPFKMVTDLILYMNFDLHACSWEIAHDWVTKDNTQWNGKLKRLVKTNLIHSVLEHRYFHLCICLLKNSRFFHQLSYRCKSHNHRCCFSHDICNLHLWVHWNPCRSIPLTLNWLANLALMMESRSVCQGVGN